MKKIFRSILIVIVVLIVGLFISYLWIEHNLNQLAQARVPEVQLSLIDDGEYVGSYKAFPIDVELSVVVQDHKIINILLNKHVTGQGQGAEIILEDVIEQNSIDVDVVSGATYSSKVILHAISNALNGE